MLITAAGGAVLATLLGVLYLQVVMLQRQRQLDGIAEQRTEVMREYQDLRRNVAQLESPDAVVKRATDELGMVPAPEVLYLEPANANAAAEPLKRTLGDGAPTPKAAATGATASKDAAASETPNSESPAATGGTEGPAGPGAADGEPTTDAAETVSPTEPGQTEPAQTTEAPQPTPTTAATTTKVDPATGLPVDPATGKTRYDPVTGQAIDPSTGQPVSSGAGT